MKASGPAGDGLAFVGSPQGHSRLIWRQSISVPTIQHSSGGDYDGHADANRAAAVTACAALWLIGSVAFASAADRSTSLVLLTEDSPSTLDIHGRPPTGQRNMRPGMSIIGCSPMGPKRPPMVRCPTTRRSWSLSWPKVDRRARWPIRDFQVAGRRDIS